MSRSDKSYIAIVLLAVIVCVGVMIANEFQKASEMADYSAHAALVQEICHQLDAVPAGEPFPESLAQLELTYPDGGDSELLERFKYRRTSDGCILHTRIGDRVFEQTFPRKDTNRPIWW